MRSNQAGKGGIKMQTVAMETEIITDRVHFTKVGHHKKMPYNMQTNSLNAHHFSKAKPLTLKYIVMLADGGQEFLVYIF